MSEKIQKDSPLFETVPGEVLEKKKTAGVINGDTVWSLVGLFVNCCCYHCQHFITHQLILKALKRSSQNLTSVFVTGNLSVTSRKTFSKGSNGSQGISGAVPVLQNWKQEVEVDKNCFYKSLKIQGNELVCGEGKIQN